MGERNENIRYSKSIFCLPTKAPFKPFAGKVPEKDSIMLPADIPSTLTESMSEDYAVNPEHVLTKFLEANPNFYNPRDIARIIFHSPNVSPYANSLILFNSSFSSRSLLLSFITAIDMDCISLTVAIAQITSKVALPDNTIAIMQLVEMFAKIYSMRNPLEWPDKTLVRDIFYSVITAGYFKKSFHEMIKSFPSLNSLSKYVIEQLSHEVSDNPPPIYITSCPIRAAEELATTAEHEGRYMASWNKFYYKKVKLGDTQFIIYSYKDEKSKEVLSEIPLDYTTATFKTGIKGNPWILYLTRVDGMKFGSKVKDGVMRESSRTSYTISFKDENDLLTWISSINATKISTEMTGIIQAMK